MRFKRPVIQRNKVPVRTATGATRSPGILGVSRRPFNSLRPLKQQTLTWRIAAAVPSPCSVHPKIPCRWRRTQDAMKCRVMFSSTFARRIPRLTNTSIAKVRNGCFDCEKNTHSKGLTVHNRSKRGVDVNWNALYCFCNQDGCNGEGYRISVPITSFAIPLFVVALVYE